MGKVRALLTVTDMPVLPLLRALFITSQTES
jgi:hypothetical protein